MNHIFHFFYVFAADPVSEESLEKKVDRFLCFVFLHFYKINLPSCICQAYLFLNSLNEGRVRGTREELNV